VQDDDVPVAKEQVNPNPPTIVKTTERWSSDGRIIIFFYVQCGWSHPTAAPACRRLRMEAVLVRVWGRADSMGRGTSKMQRGTSWDETERESTTRATLNGVPNGHYGMMAYWGAKKPPHDKDEKQYLN
jgi:hypothetical protein